MAHSIFKPKRKDKATGKSKESRYWWGQYRLEGDLEYTRLSLTTTDKRVAQQKLAEIVTREERLRAGILAPQVQTEAATTPMSDHLDGFIAYQASRNCSETYTRKIRQRVSRLIEECRWQRVRDVTAESFIAWRQRQGDLSAKTLNDYQDAIYCLLEWLRKTDRILCNPIERVDRVHTAGKRTFKRRALSDAEVERLLEVHPERRWIYLIALHTGLRRAELETLEWEHVDPAARLIRLKASNTKSKRGDVLPITPVAAFIFAKLRGELRQHTNGSGKVFSCRVPHPNTFRRDLAKAKVPRFDARGRKADFHALRTTFITNLHRAGVPQRIAMALARHTDPKLTANIYTDTDALPLAEAVAKLPTYGVAITPETAHGDAQEMYAERRPASHDDTDSTTIIEPKTPCLQGISCVAERQPVTPDDDRKKRRGGDSNPRCPEGHTGFRDRRVQPLRHLSDGVLAYRRRHTSQAPSDSGEGSGM